MLRRPLRLLAIRLTTLPDTCASLALATDVPMNAVSDRLGHSTVTMAENL